MLSAYSCGRAAAFLSIAVFSAAPLGAAVLDFEGAICGGPCINASEISQDYGDIAGEVDVVYDGDTGTAGDQPLSFWKTGYTGLTNVAYSQGEFAGLSILFDALPGFGVHLESFLLSTYLGRSPTTSVRITDIGTSTVLFDSGPFEIDLTLPPGYFIYMSSDSGLLVELGPDAWNVAIDDVIFHTYALDDPPAPVPLPATGLLLSAALAFAIAAGRRR